MKILPKVITIGAGSFGLKRLQACLNLPNDLQVVGVVESDEEKRKKLSKIYPQFGIFPTISEASKSLKNIDLAIISTPNNTHSELCTEALSNNMHVLCEKPLAISDSEAKKIVLASKKHKKLVKTGSNHRFFVSVQKAFELFKKDKIGKILSFRASIGTNGERTASSWFGNAQFSGGGTLIDNGCHMLDIARMFMGDFEKCFGMVDNLYWKNTQVEDIAQAFFVKKDGTQCSLTCSWFQWQRYMYFEIWGEKGFIIVDNTNEDRVIWGEKGSPFFKVYNYTNGPKNSYEQEILYMLDCIKKDDQPSPNAIDGAAVIHMITKVYESAKSGRWEKL